MGKAITLLVITYTLLALTSSFTAGFQGGKIPHFFTNRYETTTMGSDVLVPFDRPDIFDSSEDIFAATALNGFGSADPGTSIDAFPHVEFSSVGLNSGRTSALINIKINPNYTSTDKSVNFVAFSIIVIGSRFDDEGANDVSQSSVLVRNGKMFETRDNSAVLYDFETDSLGSLFNFNAAQNTRCGAFKVSGIWRIENQECEYSGFHIFITGFSRFYTNQIGANKPFVFEVTPGGGANMNQDPQGLTITFEEDETLDGISLINVGNRGTDTFFKEVQYSLVFVGLNEHTANYPVQILNRDPFLYNFANRQAASNFDISSGNGDLLIPKSSAVDTFYYDQTNQDVSHFFCGFFRLQLTFQTPASTTSYSFEFNDVDLAAETNNFGDTNTNGLIINRIGLTCEIFTLRDSCTVDSSDVSLEGIPTFSPASADVDFIVFPSPTILADFANTLGILQTTSTASTIVYTINYMSIENKGYEGAFEFRNRNPLAAALGAFNFDIKVEAFGKVVINERDQAFGVFTRRFAFFNFDTTGNNKVVITFTTDYADASGDLEMELGIALKEHDQLLDSDQNCVSACVNQAGKDVGLTLATSPPQCLLCDKDSLNRVFDADENNQGQCICEPNRFEQLGICQPCTSDSLCKVCDIDTPENCLECMENSQLKNESNPTSGCQCFSGFFPSDNGQFLTCQTCPDGCATCSSSTTCQTCVTSTTREGPTLQCRCKAGFYSDGNIDCVACPSECAECESATKCTSCVTEKKFRQEGNTCVCEDSYFLVIGSTEKTCQECDPTCKTCSGTASNCKDCIDDTRSLITENGEGRCPCAAKYTEINGECVDNNCQTIDPFCKECYILIAVGEAKRLCKSCMGDNRLLNNETNSCECAVGYREDGDFCVACPDGCQKCSNSSYCELCAHEAGRNADGSCSCPQKTFLKNLDNKLYCQACDDNCLVCEGTSSTCTECTNGFTAKDKLCVCGDGTYLSFDLTRCISCPLNCNKCTSRSDCESCDSFTSWNNDTKMCVKECPIGTYNSENQCKQCSDFCSACTTSYNCQRCFNGYYKFAGACRTQCPVGTYPNQFECSSCASPCQTCTRDAQTCTTCVEGYILVGNDCSVNCPERHFFSGNTCYPCDSSCYNCDQSAKNCVSCPSGKHLVDGKCEDKCPHVLINGKCTDNCPPGSFLNGQTCSPCAGDCDTCSDSSTNCKSCKNGLLTYNGNCISNCPANTIKIEDYCLDCDSTCNGCSGNPFSCLDCKPGNYHLNGRCVNNCPEGYYIDYALRTCRPCDANCKVCTGPGSCQICEDLTISPTNQCDNECGPNCLKCEDYECLLCAEGTIWTGILCLEVCPQGSEPVDGICVCNSGYMHDNQCKPFCPAGTLISNGRCLNCASGCVECTNTVNFCTACPDGLVLDPVSGRCETANECPFGRYRNAFGQCKVICPPGEYFLASTCYDSECPPGYKAEKTNQACIEDSVPAGCTKPKFLQGRECVDICSPGFWPNPTNRVCEGCSVGCYSCLSAQYCTSCNVGFSLLNNECVSSDKCPAGLSRYQTACLSYCPIGTFAKDGFCLRQCPAGTKKKNFGCYDECEQLSTPDACVSSCPSGFSQSGSNCVLNSKTCGAGQFFDANRDSCSNCASLCKSCEGAYDQCTDCHANYLLDGHQCKPKNVCSAGKYLANSGCLDCPAKCGTCVNANDCTSCAENYINTGADCVKNTNVLNPVQMQVISTTKRDTTAYVQLRPTIIPNDLDPNLQSQIILTFPSEETSNPIINTWVDGSDIWVALRYEGFIPSGRVYFALNSEVMDSLYRNIGYTTKDTFTSANINDYLPPTPQNVQIPARAINSLKSKKPDAGPLNSILYARLTEERL